MARQWLPSEWMDEMPPQTADHPSAFLKRNAAGVLQLTAIDWDGDGDNGPAPTDIEPGAEVAFTWTEPRGTSTVTIRDDWSWSVNPPFDADTNCFRDEAGEYEDVFPSLQDLVDSMRENGFEPGPIEVEGWTWSDDVLFEVRILESGAATFVEIARPTDAGHPHGNEHPVRA